MNIQTDIREYEYEYEYEYSSHTDSVNPHFTMEVTNIRRRLSTAAVRAASTVLPESPR